MAVTFDHVKLTLNGAASYGYGKETFRRNEPVDTEDAELVAWAQGTGRFKVEPIIKVDPEREATLAELAGKLEDLDAPVEADPDEPAPVEAAPDDRNWSDDALKALLEESVRAIEPRLTEMTPADLDRLREFEAARPDTRSTLLTEIDQERRKR